MLRSSPLSATPCAPPNAVALLLLPLCVLADGALFWPAACLVAMGAAIERRPGAMLVWYGLAVGFDANALVLAPFVVALSLRLRAGWRMTPLAPAFALAMLLARSHGVPLDFVLPQDVALSDGAPTLWAIVEILAGADAPPLAGLALTGAVGVCVCYGAWALHCRLQRRDLLDAGLLGAMLPVVLPAIGPRALLLAVVLAPIVAVLDPRPRRWWVAALVIAGAGSAWLGGRAVAPLGAVAMLAAAALHARALLARAANDNPRSVPVLRPKPLPSLAQTC